MSPIVKEVCDAFLEAGVSETKATEATKAIADYNDRFNKIRSDFIWFPRGRPSLGTR